MRWLDGLPLEILHHAQFERAIRVPAAHPDCARGDAVSAART
jgi:hypothetical protein